MANTLNKITTKSILDATVATADIAADAITGAKIADDAIDSEHYTDGSIDTAHIADDAVTEDKLANAINTSIAGKAVLTGSTNNTITTVTGANAIQGEADLTFDGTKLGLGATGDTKFNLLTGGDDGISLGKTASGTVSSGDVLGSYAFQSGLASQTTVSAEAKISGIAAENSSGSTAATDLAFFTKPTGTGPGSAPTERLRINSDGDIWQGGTTSSTARFAIQGASANTSATHADTNGVSLILSNTDTTNNNWQGIEFSDRTDSGDFITGILSTCTNHSSNYGDLTFWTNGSGGRAERARITSDGDFNITGHLVMAAAGKGIDFSDTGDAAGATSELLDDYEEGTFTPTLQNDLGTTYTDQTGRYVKIGSLVHVNAFVKINNEDGSATNTTGISNMPFANGSGMTVTFLLTGNNSWDANLTDSNIAGWFGNGSTLAAFYKNSGGNLNGISVNDIGTGGEIAVSITYRTS